MAVGNNFANVREAFCGNLAAYLRQLNVEIKAATPKGDWLQVKCPFCTDTSGSASISIASGFLRCHQCSAKADLFTWVGKSIGVESPWLQCQALAKIVGVAIVGVPNSKKLYKVIPEITTETASEFKQRLYEDDDQEIAREFLRRRQLWVPDKLEALPLGAFGGKIIFFQHDDNGKLRKRARVYDPFPLNTQPKWSWNKVKGQTGRTVGFWPVNDKILKMDLSAILLLLEGEWDVLTAILRLGLLERNVMVQTWTGGGGAPIPADAVAEYQRNREVHLLYDNDVFQGVGEKDLAPDDKKFSEMQVRKKNLLEQIGPSFVTNRCTVFVRAITIPPIANWGGDFRDMVDNGLQSIDELPVYKLAECRKELKTARRVEFNDVHKHLNSYIEFKCQVAGVADDVSVKMERAHVRCEMGQHSYCSNCRLQNIAPNGVIDFTGMQSELACAMTDNNVTRNIMERICGKPGSCKQWAITPVNSHDGARWSAMATEDDNEEGMRTVEILSDDQPPLSGELVVRGWLYMSANGLTPVLMCDHLAAGDRVTIPIEPHKVDLLHECPPQATTVEQIDEYLDRWSTDVANHTTRVYGRRDMHVALGLTMHSVLWLDVFGARRRGWLDICIMGATRTGKSAAARAYVKALFGQHFTPMGNFSRPGLTLGTVTINGQGKMKPGVFPRNHGKLLILDEAHLMVMDNVAGGGLFPMLQGARDIGKVEAAKISGSQVISAAVRLVAIANWMDGGKHSYSSPAAHLLALYGTPESLARLDFGLPIDEIQSGFGPEDCPNFWTAERQRVVAIRAWHMLPSQVVFTDEALEEAQRMCTTVWKDKYSEELPLFTEKEKVYSVLRIATAIANMTLSHPNGEINKCLVDLVQVQWACKWLEHTWKMLEYEQVSRKQAKTMEPKTIWRIECLLTVRLNLTDPNSVNYVIGRLFGMLSKEELRAVVGLDAMGFEKWTTDLVRCGALEIVRPSAARHSQLAFRFTKGACMVIQQLVALAEQCPEEWATRQSKLNLWSGGAGGVMPQGSPNGIIPIDAPMELHREQRQQRFDQ